MVSGNFTLNLWFPFWGPGHSICRAQVNTTLGFPSDSKNWPFKKGLTKARRRGFELQSSDLWGSRNDLSAQLQIQLIGLEPNLSHFSSLKSLHEKHVFRSFWGLSGGGLYVYVTGHDRQKRALGFPVRRNASQNKSLQNAFPIFECQMERRYKIQCTPFYYKNWCTGPFFFAWILHETGDGIKHVCSPF